MITTQHGRPVLSGGKGRALLAWRQSLRVVLGKQESTVGAPAFLSKPGFPSVPASLLRWGGRPGPPPRRLHQEPVTQLGRKQGFSEAKQGATGLKAAPGCRPDALSLWETPCSPGSSCGRRGSSTALEHHRPDAQVNLPERRLMYTPLYRVCRHEQPYVNNDT